MTNRSETASNFPGPPPPVAGLFFPPSSVISREIQKSAWQALTLYCMAINLKAEPWPEWKDFERGLAYQFAALLISLRRLPREAPRRKLLDLFLESLNLENKLGRARKAREHLKDHCHGAAMTKLWQEELQPAWNMKTSPNIAAAEIRSRLRKAFGEDVVCAVLSRKATPESSLAAVYARRANLSKGRARNALREYKRQNEQKFATHV